MCNHISFSLSERVLSQLAFTCSKLTIETLQQDVEYVQSYNKDTRTTPSMPKYDFNKVAQLNWNRTSAWMASFWCLYCQLWTYSTSCCSVSIVNFEHVIAGWGKDFVALAMKMHCLHDLSKCYSCLASPAVKVGTSTIIKVIQK